MSYISRNICNKHKKYNSKIFLKKFLIAFIFSVIPNTRDINIQTYNKLVLNWVELAPIIHGTNITIQSDVSEEISFYRDYRMVLTQQKNFFFLIIF